MTETGTAATPRGGRAERIVRELLEAADIEVNGSRPWDIQVHDSRLYRRVLAGGSLALGESYMDGWWDAEALDQFIERVFIADLKRKVRRSPRLVMRMAPHLLAAQLGMLQSRRRAGVVVKSHYDAGNDLYQAMLDPSMTYSCAYWQWGARSLEQAQEDKHELICQKLHLEPGMRVLDIGCGYGSFAFFAAAHHGVSVVGLNLSKEQLAYDQKERERLGCHASTQFEHMDYRDAPKRFEPFDRVVSVGMFEHVGVHYYPTFFDVARSLLRDDGLMLLHTIGGNYSTVTTDAWMQKYIFPGGMIPSVAQIGEAFEGRFVMEDWHNFGADYERTLLAWYQNVRAAWPKLTARYDERFRRMREYYLLACAASFRVRKNQLWQIMLSPKGVPGGYQRVR